MDGCPHAEMAGGRHALQQILHESRPDVLVETGSCYGGSALFYAHMMDLIGHGRVISMDIRKLKRPEHPRITYLKGDSVKLGATLADELQGKKVMVSLDSDHAAPHVLAELQLFAPMVTKGQYLVVEDTNLNGRPVWPGFGPGPYEALQEFKDGLGTTGFRDMELGGVHLFSYHTWLKKVAA